MEIPEGAWSQRVGEGRLWTTWDLMVRRTGEPTAVRRGTLLLPDCAVMTSPGLREFAPVAMDPWNVAGAGAGRYLPVEGAARPFTGVAGAALGAAC